MKKILAASALSAMALLLGDAAAGAGAAPGAGAATTATATAEAASALPGAHAGHFDRTADGVVVTPASGAARRVQLQVMNDHIIHVTALPAADVQPLKSLMVNAAPDAKATYEVRSTAGKVILKTKAATAEVSLATGAVEFLNAKGEPVLTGRNSGAFTPVTLDGQPYYSLQQQFNLGTDEGFYGLGQHQNAQMNYNGEDVELSQHNIDVAIPFVISSRNYGVLWDNNSITRFGDPHAYGLASRDLTITNAEGKPGFTAKYYVKGQLRLTRTEADINYRNIRDLANRPAEMLGTTSSNTSAQKNDIAGETVTWEGNLTSPITGTHKFELYIGSYYKLYVGGKLVFDRWRQNWNPWYQNFEVPMTAGKPVAIRIEWTPNDSHIALLHNNPLPAAERHSLSLFSEAGRSIDYYFVAGDNMDQVIAGYRELTGKAVLLPRWVYGFWQSRQRYKTQDEILDVVQQYRKRHLPLDNIVEDWFYWREDDWGSHQFDPKRFPDPQGMVDQLHAMNAHFMISVWPKFYPTTKNYQELDAKGYIYKRNVAVGEHDWVGEKGYLNSYYDPYSAEARQIYWRQINENLKKYGIDAWWLDATEPDIHSNLDIAELKARIGPTAIGPSTVYFNSYPLMQTTAVFDGERQASPDTRSFILTRSAFAGQQRNGAATWSGDVASRWDDLKNQISAGVNFSMSGIPNWSFDIGGFSLEERYLKPNDKDLAEWRELQLRWFQFGAFVPLFRSHGEEPFREIYNLAPEGSEIYNSLVAYDQQRYRLMPYIYTQAADTYFHNGVIMRGLVMDFGADPKVRNLNDEYLFGPSLLVSPVYKFQARTRKVYLPAGAKWYDFYTGAAQQGGVELEAAAPLARMPLFVKAGAIIPVGPAIEYTGQKPNAPLTLFIYTGADGSFSLYEDNGLNLGYTRGEYARVPMHYDDKAGTLTLGAREGSYPGMAPQRLFNVRWISGRSAAAADFDAAPDQSVEYSGQQIVLKRVTAAGTGTAHPALWPEARSQGLVDATTEERITQLMSGMTLEEKVGQTIQADIGTMKPEELRQYPLGSILAGGGSPPLGTTDERAPAQYWLDTTRAYRKVSLETRPGHTAIPVIFGIDSVHGDNNVRGATLFPHNVALGAAHDPALAGRIAVATAEETAVIGADWAFGPTLTVPQDPRWGRSYEGYSEDPALVKSYSAAVVKGLQGDVAAGSLLQKGHVAASVKHFLGDGGTERGSDQGDDAHVSEQSLIATHAQGYPAAIDAGVLTVMASYSSWQGHKMHGNETLLNGVLKGRMGFEGFVVGDWNAHAQIPGCTKKNCPAAINAGIDMFMAPDGWKTLFRNTVEQVRSGVIPMARVDDAVRRILRVKFRLGLFDEQRPWDGRFELLGSSEHRALAREAVRKSLVLLKNNHGVLPIKSGAHVLVAGAGADDIGMQSGGWTLSWQGTGNKNADFPNAQSIFSGLSEALRAGGGSAELSANGEYQQKPDVAIVVYGEQPYAEMGGDVPTLAYSAGDDHDLALLKKLQAQHIPVVSVFLSGRVLWVNPELNASDAFVAAWQPGSEGGGVADVLIGDATGKPRQDFTGRLSYTWPATAAASSREARLKAPLFANGYGLSYVAQDGKPARQMAALPEVSGVTAAAANRKNYLLDGRTRAPWTLVVTGAGSVKPAEGFQQLSWSGRGAGSLSLHGPGANLVRSADADSALLVTYRVDAPPTAPVRVTLGCVPVCGLGLDLGPVLSASPVGEWRTIRIRLADLRNAGVDTKEDPDSDFAGQSGADLSRVTDAFVLSTTGTLRLSLQTVRVVGDPTGALQFTAMADAK